MEWRFWINWSAIVEEAKQRRKSQRLTQFRLAKMAKVSTPTVSRFENGHKDIQLSSVIQILRILGMHDARHLVFSTSESASYDPDRMMVVFAGQDHEKKILCGVSLETLRFQFGNQGEAGLKIFHAHREQIQHAARCKYLASVTMASFPNGMVIVEPVDLSM